MPQDRNPAGFCDILSEVNFSQICLNSVSKLNVDKSEMFLVEAAARGDRDARRELFERYRNLAYGVAYRITGRNEDALDVVQDSYINAFDNLEKFQRQSAFKTWLLRIVSNRALDLLRSRKVRLAISLDGGDDDGGPDLPAHRDTDHVGGRALEHQELAERLRQAIESLPPDKRAVFALYASGDMTYGQIA